MSGDTRSDRLIAAKASFEVLAESRCLVIRWRPPGELRAHVIVCQGFGDEANLSRRMVRLFAENAAARGIMTSLVDCSGTGDSVGELADANPSKWLSELTEFASHAIRHSECPNLMLGVRFGAAMALQLADQVRGFVGLMCWAPVFDGKDQLKQLLRMALVKEPGLKQRARELWEQGETVRLAGYDISAAMAVGLERLDLPSMHFQQPMLFVEVRSTVEPGVAPVVSAGLANRVATLGFSGASPVCAAVAGAPFWNVADPVDCPELICLTIECIERWIQPHPPSGAPGDS